MIRHVINDTNNEINNVTQTYIMKLHLHEHERVCDETEKQRTKISYAESGIRKIHKGCTSYNE